MLTRIVAGGNILLNLMRGKNVNREWQEIRGSKLNIERCLREIGHSGAKVVRAGRENIFVELHRDELKWLQTKASDLSLKMVKTKEPTYSTARCGAFSINVKMHQIACTHCAHALAANETERENEASMNQKKKLFRNSDRAEAIRDYAVKFPTASLDTFIEPLQGQGWMLGHNRASQMKTLDNALRPYRGASSNQRGYLLKGRAYAATAEPAEVVEAVEDVAIDLISTTPDPGIDVEDLIGDSDPGINIEDLVGASDIFSRPEPIHSNVEEQEPEPPATIVTDSVLITTLDGLVQMAQQRVDEHMTLADQWESIKGTIMSLVFTSQESEEKLRSAQAEVEAARSKLNAVVAAMSDNGDNQG